MGAWRCIYKSSSSKYCYGGREIRIIQQLEDGRDFCKAKLKALCYRCNKGPFLSNASFRIQAQIAEENPKNVCIFLFVFTLPCLSKAAANFFRIQWEELSSK